MTVAYENLRVSQSPSPRHLSGYPKAQISALDVTTFNGVLETECWRRSNKQVPKTALVSRPHDVIRSPPVEPFLPVDRAQNHDEFFLSKISLPLEFPASVRPPFEDDESLVR